MLHGLWTGGWERAWSFLPHNCWRIVTGSTQSAIKYLLSRSVKIAAIKEGVRICREIYRDIDGCSPRESNVGSQGHCGGIDLQYMGVVPTTKKSFHDFSLRVNRRRFRNMRGDKVAKYMNTHSQQPKPKFSKSYCLLALNVQHFNVYDTCHWVSFIARCSSFYRNRFCTHLI